MVTAVQPIAPVETPSALAQRVEAGFARRPVAPEPEPEPLLRLVIEEDPGSGDFVYKTIDRVTGEVVRQFPREEMLRMARDARYGPGDIIETDV